MSPELRALKDAIEAALAARLPAHSAIAQPLIDAMRYASLGGGKRLRPMIVCATCLDLGGTLDRALAPACAVEFMHAYSLIHDDLPCMDDDDLRHGVPSCHVAHGEATAVLAGDALQALAFETFAAAPGLEAQTRIDMIDTLARAVGWAGMVGGQQYDLVAEGAHLDTDQLRTLHRAKTGALFEAAVCIGTLCAGERVARLAGFGERLGLAFQVIDDVLDITRTSEQLGKPARSDLENSKSTFVALMGVVGARTYARELLAELVNDLAAARLHEGLLAELASRAVEREF
jgi:farnesyl diphosphate synthase